MQVVAESLTNENRDDPARNANNRRIRARIPFYFLQQVGNERRHT